MADSRDRREYQRQWAEANKDRLREYKRRWRKDNADRVREQRHEYYIANREPIIAKSARNYKENREARRAWQRVYMHSMRPEEYAKLWAAQAGCCYLCGDVLVAEQTHIDHDHTHCGKRKSCRTCWRGLACAACNCAIGYLRDDPDRMRKVADALEVAKDAFEKKKAELGEQLTLGGD